MGLLTDGGGGKQKGPLPKICSTYPTIMKLGAVTPYPKKIRKINESRDTPLISADISIFHLKSATMLYQEIQRLYFGTYFLFILTFLESWFVVVKSMVKIFMMSAKMAASALLKIKVFWNIGYYVIYFVYGGTNKILSHDSNHIIDVVIWSKFGNYSICIIEVIIISIL